MDLRIIIIVSLLIFVSIVMSRMDKKIENKESKKGCRLHKWNSVQQPGVEPTTYYLKCEYCGKLPNLNLVS